MQERLIRDVCGEVEVERPWFGGSTPDADGQAGSSTSGPVSEFVADGGSGRAAGHVW